MATKAAVGAQVFFKGPDRERRVLFKREYENLQQKVLSGRKDHLHACGQLAAVLQQEFPDIAEVLHRVTRSNDASLEGPQRKSHGSLRSISSQITSVGNLLSRAKSGRSNDAEDLRSTLQSINNELYETKILNDTEESRLKMEESKLRHELHICYKEAESVGLNEDSTATRSIRTGYISRVAARGTKPQPLLDFEKYCAVHGGTTGGWDDFDHNEFLSFRQRHGPIEMDLAVQAAALIPTKSAKQIVDHEEWYHMYTLLLSAKKDAVAGWKLAKQEQQKKIAAQLAADENLREGRLHEIHNAKQEKRKIQLKAAKSAKEKADKETAEQVARKALQEEEDSRRRFTEHQTKLTTRLEEHYSQIDERLREIQLEEERKLEEVKERRQDATLQVVELGLKASMDAEYKLLNKRQIEEKRRKGLVKKREAAETLRKSVTKHIKRDRARVAKATKGWSRKIHADMGDGDLHEKIQELAEKKWQPSLTVFNMAKLKLPEWRKGHET